MSLSSEIKVCLITDALAKTGEVFLKEFLPLLTQIFNNLCIITGNVNVNRLLTVQPDKNKIRIFNLKYTTSNILLWRVIKYIVKQLRISRYVFKPEVRQAKIIIFAWGGSLLLIPLLFLKIMRKKVVLIGAASETKMSKKVYDYTIWGSFIIFSVALMEKITYFLFDSIVVYSPAMINELNLKKWGQKVKIADRHYIDFNTFKIEKKIKERVCVCGYLGRFSKEKGIENFLRAIEKILKNEISIEVLIGGDGELKDYVIEFIANKGVGGQVKFLDWVPHESLPKYLNELSLLVIPSYTEGLPTIMLEAMACGTPVLATPVGAVPEIIKDSKTGFILEDNSPEAIAQGIIRVIKFSEIEHVITNAVNLVKTRNSFEAAVERYKKVFSEVLSNYG